MLVVAADGGWEAQTAEHVAALDALGVQHGLVAVTRSDLADPDPVCKDVLDRLAGTSLGSETLEAIAVSGRTGDGLPELRAALDRLIDAAPATRHDRPGPALGRPRVHDRRRRHGRHRRRSGAGTVRVGDELELAGAGGSRRVHVRGLQALGGPESEVSAVARVALNLRGISLSEVARGDALLTPGADLLTRVGRRRRGCRRAIDLSELPAELVLHLGAAGVPVRVRPLASDFARLTLDWPLPLRRGDRALLRDPGRQSVVAAVTVADIDPPAARASRRRAHPGRPARRRSRRGRRGRAARCRATAPCSHQLGVLAADEPLPHGVREVGGLLVTDAGVGALGGSAQAAWWPRRSPPTRWPAACPPRLPPSQLGIADVRLIEPLAAAAGLQLKGGRVHRSRRRRRSRRLRRPRTTSSRNACRTTLLTPPTPATSPPPA